MTEIIHILTHALYHVFIDTLALFPFLFVTYFLMEFIEHSAKDKAEEIIKKSGRFGPALGGVIGIIPQCGFSAGIAGLFSGGVITLGTLLAVFLSTSDEMLPIMISRGFPARSIVIILLTKALLGMAVGFAVDLVFRRRPTHREIGHICEEEGCHCEEGIFRSALHHTLSVGVFILAIGFVIEAVIGLIGEDTIALYLSDTPIVSNVIASLVGLIPNCASSVILTELYLEGIISAGAMMSGLFSGAGIGILVLLKTSKSTKMNAVILSLLFISGVVLGIALDLVNFELFI